MTTTTPGRRLRWSIYFEPRDCWMGLFWDRRADGLYVYVCLIPCVPLRIVWRRP